MGLNFLHVSDHNWAEKMFTDMRNRTMAYLERKDRSLILAPLLTTLEKGIKTYTYLPIHIQAKDINGNSRKWNDPNIGPIKVNLEFSFSFAGCSFLGS